MLILWLVISFILCEQSLLDIIQIFTSDIFHLNKYFFADLFFVPVTTYFMYCISDVCGRITASKVKKVKLSHLNIQSQRMKFLFFRNLTVVTWLLFLYFGSFFLSLLLWCVMPVLEEIYQCYFPTTGSIWL